ncbi:pseudouridine synthase [Calycina marina]|uniref:Pseudouridine synthase n=1 Tax=Calycina marina TaxID=1763456 RepID=A0A9P7Z6F0_9HELO|nr:pseudouridine synthase [Calycina marina]
MEIDAKEDYSMWTNEKLIARVTQLEAELKSKNESIPPMKKNWKKRTERVFDPSKYCTRFVAFKLAYLGKRYNGFEYTKTKTPLPTVEEEIWKALNKTRLIFPVGGPNPMKPGDINWEGMDYSKCGRTDKGVSAFGQVIALRVRSNRPLATERKAVGGELNEKPDGRHKVGEYWNMFPQEETAGDEYNTLPRENAIETASPSLDPERYARKELSTNFQVLDHEEKDYDEALDFDPTQDEIQYCSLLNRQLPPDIRMLAWCPSPPLDFSARFSCRERRYKYFFTQPAFSPTPHHLETGIKDTNSMKEGWLDIKAMQEAAKLYEGLHDFRNFCKVDGGKQISNYERRIFSSTIDEVEDQTSGLAYVKGSDFLSSKSPSSTSNPKVYTFSLNGSAFLWHQVRHMVAILFLVGQRLEKPSIVSELLDVKTNPRRPIYEMATDTPLVLWDCIFPQTSDPERKDAIQWHYVGDGPKSGDAKYGTAGLMDNLWETWRERKIDEMLAGALVGVVSKQGNEVSELEVGDGSRGSKSQKIFDGDDRPRLQGRYVPVMQKHLMEPVEKVNEKYAIKKGFEGSEDMKKQGYRTLKKMGPGYQAP